MKQPPAAVVSKATFNNKQIVCRAAFLVIPALVAGIYRSKVLVQIPVLEHGDDAGRNAHLKR